MKRIMDVTVALVALVLLSPLLGAVALAIRVSMGSPVIFRHLRPGKDGVPFTVRKFRTMRDPLPGEPPVGDPAGDPIRLTRMGGLLRRTSIDELPQLWNVLRGEMSLVGPRPLLREYLPHYSPEQARRHDVRPGITGWAQVNGRNSLPWKERLELDVWYVDHCSLALDLRIIGMTLMHLLRPAGVMGLAGLKNFDREAQLATTAGKETS